MGEHLFWWYRGIGQRRYHAAIAYSPTAYCGVIIGRAFVNGPDDEWRGPEPCKRCLRVIKRL